MTSLLTRLPRTTFEHIAAFLPLEAKEALHRVCSAIRPLLLASCYHHDAIDLDFSEYPHSHVDAAQQRRRVDRLIALLPHVATIRIHDLRREYDDTLPAGLQGNCVAAVKGKWLTNLRLEESHLRECELGAAVFGALAERGEDSPLSSFHWSMTTCSSGATPAIALLCGALVRCPQLTSLAIDLSYYTEANVRQLVTTFPISLTHFYLISSTYVYPHEQVLIDAFRCPTFLPNLTALLGRHESTYQSWTTRALPVIAECAINDAGERRPIQHLLMDHLAPDMFPSIAELTQVTKWELPELRNDVDWAASTAAFPSILPHLRTVLLHPSHFPAPRALQWLLQLLSTRPVRELSIRCTSTAKPLTQPAWAALAAMQSMQSLTIAGSDASDTCSKGLTTNAADLRLLPLSGWPVLFRLDLTAFALSAAELATVVSASPLLSCFKLCVAFACASECIPLIGQHCVELRELELMSRYSKTRVSRVQLLRALTDHSQPSSSLLPHLERLRVHVLDDAAVHLLLHRLRASPLRWIDVSPLHTSLWRSPTLVAVLCRCSSLRVIHFSGRRWSGGVLDVLTQRDGTSTTELRFLQRSLPAAGVYPTKAVDAALREDSGSRAELCSAVRALLKAEDRRCWSDGIDRRMR